MPRADGTLNAKEKAADIWQQQHWVDADGYPAERQGPDPASLRV